MNIAIIFIFGIIIQIFLSRYFIFSGIGINVMLLLTIEVSLIKGPVNGMSFGFFSGIFEDIYSMGIIGAGSLIRTITAFFAGSVKGKFAVKNAIFQFILVFILSIIHGLFMYLIRIIFAYPEISVMSIIGSACVNGIIAPLVFLIVEKIIAR